MPPERHLITFVGLSEPLSSGTHFLAALFALLLAPLMLRRAGSAWHRRLACAIYLTSAVGMYGVSSTYHAMGCENELRPLFWRIDHASIWLVLSSTFVAIRVLILDGRFQLAEQGPLWAVALAGATLELSVIDRLPLWVSPLLYVGMGWLGFPTLLGVARRVGWDLGGAMLAGGLLATLGGFMDSTSQPCPVPGLIEAHELLHVATTIGGALFWSVVFRAADGRYSPKTLPGEDALQSATTHPGLAPGEPAPDPVTA